MPPARRPRVLVSNDDGIHAPGLRSLVAALAATGEADIYVCSPSGAGGRISIGNPRPIEQTKE